jgi:hypothetical protein
MVDKRITKKSLKMGAAVAATVVVASVLLYVGLQRSEAARASPAPNLLSTLPAGAPLLIYLDLAAVRASGFYQHRPDRGPMTLPDRSYADFVQATGFDFEKDLDRVVIAAWPQGLAQEKKGTVAVAEGRFDRRKIREYAMKNGKVDRQQGHDVFLFSARDPGGWDAITFLDDHRIAMVEGSSVASVISPHAVDAVSDPIRERAARVDGAAVFAISRVPAIPDNFAPGGMQSAELNALIRSVQWVTLAARPEGDDLRVSLEGECQTNADARQLQSALQTVFLVGRMELESPKSRQSMDPAAFELFDNLLKMADVSETAERVRILVEITPDVMKLAGPSKQK